MRGPLRSASSMALVLRLAPLLFFLLFLLSSKSISALSQTQLVSMLPCSVWLATACRLSSQPACPQETCILVSAFSCVLQAQPLPPDAASMGHESQSLNFCLYWDNKVVVLSGP